MLFLILLSQYFRSSIDYGRVCCDPETEGNNVSVSVFCIILFSALFQILSLFRQLQVQLHDTKGLM